MWPLRGPARGQARSLCQGCSVRGCLPAAGGPAAAQASLAPHRPPPPAVQTLRLCSHLGPSPRCGWSQFSQPGHDLGPADQPRGTSGRRGVPPPDRPGARVWSWPLSAPSSLQASGLLQPFAACAWPSAVLFFLEVVSGRLSDHPVALSFAAARLLGLQGEAAASGRPEAPRRPAGTRL